MSKKASKFNVSKKLAQLVKVIELLEAQKADREFKMEEITRRFHDAIDEEVDRVGPELLQISTTMEDMQKTLADRIELEYQKRYKAMHTEAAEFIKSAEEEIIQFQKCEEAEIQKMANEVQQISESIVNERNQFERQCEEAQNAVKASVTELDTKYQEEATAHDIESERRIAELQREYGERMKELENEHLRARDGVIGDPDLLKNMADMAASIAELKRNVGDFGQSITPIKDEFSQFMAREIAKLKGLNAEARRKTVFENREDELENINAEIKTTQENNIQAMAALKKRQSSEMAKHRMELQGAMDRYQALMHKHSVETNEMNDKVKAVFDESELEIQSLMNRRREEIDRVMKLHDKAVQDASLVDDRLHRDLVYLEESQTKSLISFRKQRDDEKREFEERMSRSEIGYAQEMAELLKRNAAAIEAAKLDILGCLTGGNEQEALQCLELERLREGRDQVEKEGKMRAQEAEKAHQLNVERIKAEGVIELESFRARYADECRSLRTRNDSEFIVLEGELNEEYEQRRRSYDQSHMDRLTVVKLEYSDRQDADRTAAEFEERYAREQAVLASIAEPETSSPIADELDATIAELDEEIRVLQMSRGQKRDELLDAWKKRVQDETDRHASTNLGTANECDWKCVDDLTGQIAEIIGERDVLVAELEAGIKAMESSHMFTMEHLQKRLTAARDTSEASAKSDLMNELTAKRGEVISCRQEMYRAVEAEIRETREKEAHAHAERLVELDVIEQNIDDDFASKRIAIAESSATALAEYEHSVSEANSAFESTKHSRMQIFRDIILRMKNDLESLEQKRLSQIKAFEERLSALGSSHNSLLAHLTTNHTSEMESLTSKLEEMETTLNEKLRRSIENRDQVRSRFESMPSRECDLDEIQRLEAEAATLLQQLQKATKDLQQYRWMLHARERAYSSRFGKPTVAVYSNRPKTPR